ncbi:T9SS type A sorting domain-containing protein [Marinifilum caeruleilacunae]|uniref:T9SS type A sorting domain-containing protein n=1 Tax=Marinifilum caeruleilacunae TaxID=2499076 RepID=A0ABX1X0G0_9BACT|nr:T9SS type A sorting domain-containing protein [Marinifilum caeruleilacunae]
MFKSLIKNDINEYTNPTSSLITIENNYSSHVHYKIMSASGKVVLNGMIRTKKDQLNMSGLALGVYFIKIQNQFFK